METEKEYVKCGGCLYSCENIFLCMRVKVRQEKSRRKRQTNIDNKCKTRKRKFKREERNSEKERMAETRAVFFPRKEQVTEYQLQRY